MAYTFEYDKTATIKVPVATNENGNIATSGQTAAGNKNVTIKGLKKDATHAQTSAFLSAFVGGIADGTYDGANIEGTIKFKTVESE